MRSRRGMTYVEVLAAVLILTVAAIGAAGTWAISTRAVANTRVTEMGSYLAMRELDRLKAQKYLGLTNGTQVQYGSDTFRYYDRFGAPTASNAQAAQGYKVVSTVSTAVNRDGTTNAEDLIELSATVTSNDGSRTYGTERTLLTLGGI